MLRNEKNYFFFMQRTTPNRTAAITRPASKPGVWVVGTAVDSTIDGVVGIVSEVTISIERDVVAGIVVGRAVVTVVVTIAGIRVVVVVTTGVGFVTYALLPIKGF